MSDPIIVALLGFAGTLLGSLLGILAANKLIQYRVTKLEEKVDQHDKKYDDLNSRTHDLEGRMTEAEHDIEFLKLHHQPK